MTTVTLYHARCQGIPLEQALTQIATVTDQELTGLLYSPSCCEFARRRDGQAGNASGPADLSQVFEARWFNDTLELRWLRDAQSPGTGTAVCLSEDAIELDDWEVNADTDLEPLPGQYLLSGWGSEAPNLPEGWSRLSNASVGKHLIPLADVGAHRNALLLYREYLGPAPGAAGSEHGNWSVREERLIKLAIAEDQS